MLFREQALYGLYSSGLSSSIKVPGRKSAVFSDTTRSYHTAQTKHEDYAQVMH